MSDSYEFEYLVKINLEQNGLRRTTDNEKKAFQLLSKVYGALWVEAYYDAESEEIKSFCAPLADLMTEANKLLNFKQ